MRALTEVPFEHELADLRAGADMAEAYRNAGRYREAVATFEQLWPRLVAQGRDDTATAGTWLNNWGMAVAQMGRPLEAEKLLRKSMEIQRADASDAALSPMLMTNYAQQLLDLGRVAEAQNYAQRALDSARRAGDEVVVNQTLLRLARIYRAQHELARSLEMLDEVEPRLRSALPAGEFSQAIGQAYLTLARCLRAQGRNAEGRSMAQLAADQLEKTIGVDPADTRSARELATGG